MVLSDHLLSPSGVGTQTRYFVTEMYKTGKYRFVYLAGALKHGDYTPQKITEFGDDLVIYPVDNYGNPDIIRQLIRMYKPDLLWKITDPRFYYWLYEMENEVRSNVPILYWHVWDNKPVPTYNKTFYKSVDVIASISKLTNECVQGVSSETELFHIPHAVPPDLFKTLPEAQVRAFRDAHFPYAKNKILFFWNNRNARRKQSGTLIWWFKEWLDKVGHDKAVLLMHTDPKDPNGQDLVALLQELKLQDKQIVISDTRSYGNSPENPVLDGNALALIYNAVDCTINISDAEGFGLGTLESLMCGTPIIVNMTGGLQEQVFDGTNYFGFGIQPSSRAIIGSQETPFIYEDRISQNDFNETLTKFIELPKEERKKLGKMGQKHVLEHYNFEVFKKTWENVLEHTMNKYGSWETRKGYNRWELRSL